MNQVDFMVKDGCLIIGTGSSSWITKIIRKLRTKRYLPYIIGPNYSNLLNYQNIKIHQFLMIDSTATLDKRQEILALQSQIKPNCQLPSAETNFPNPSTVNESFEVCKDYQLISQLSPVESNQDISQDQLQCLNRFAEFLSKQAHNRQGEALSSSQQSQIEIEARPFTLVNQSSQEWSKAYQQFRRQQQEQIKSLQLGLNYQQTMITQPQAQLSQEKEEGNALESNPEPPILILQGLHMPQVSENSSFHIDDVQQSHNKQEFQLIPPPKKEASIKDTKQILQILSSSLQDIFIAAESQQDYPSFSSESFQDRNSQEGASQIIPFLLEMLADSNQQ